MISFIKNQANMLLVSIFKVVP